MKNNKLTNEEHGRSMIEMLGVLAIIGVLSVGGIAGYSKAMSVYRTNKTINEISHVVINAKTLFSQQRNYRGIEQISVVQLAKIFPEGTYFGCPCMNQQSSGGTPASGGSSGSSGTSSGSSGASSSSGSGSGSHVEKPTLSTNPEVNSR